MVRVTVTDEMLARAAEIEKGKVMFDYSDRMFRKPSTVYNPKLCKISMCLTNSAFVGQMSGMNDESVTYRTIEGFMECTGYNDLEKNRAFFETATRDSAKFVLANKTLDTGERMLLIGLICGDYGAEWAGNFHVGDGSDTEMMHRGYYVSSNEVIEFTRAYLEKYDISGRVKIWICGFSRAGGIANILAGRMDTAIAKGEHIFGDRVEFAKEDVYAYCLEPLQGVWYEEGCGLPDPHCSDYDNIWNTISHNDMIVRIIMSDYGFMRYGRDIRLPSQEDEDYLELLPRMLHHFNVMEHGGHSPKVHLVDDFEMKTLSPFLKVVADRKRAHWTQGMFLDNAFTGLCDIIGGRERYVRELEAGVCFLVEYLTTRKSFKKEVGDLVKNTMREMGKDLACGRYLLQGLEGSVRRGMIHAGMDPAPAKDLAKAIKAVKGIFTRYFIRNARNSITLVTNMKGILQAHFPEVCMSWYMIMDDERY